MRLLSILAVVLVSGLGAAWSEEEVPAPLTDRLKAAEKAADPDAWNKLLKEIPPLYGPADKKQRKQLMKRLGAAVKSDLRDVARTALLVMIKIGDAELAWTEALRHVVPDRKAEQFTPFDKEIFGTVYTLHPDGAIETLLTLLRKAKNPDVAAWSMRALGGYERSAKRVHVLDELASTLLANAPGRRKGGKGSPRWNAMLPFIAATLNTLTGQKADLKTWGALWTANRKTPKLLFVHPLPLVK